MLYNILYNGIYHTMLCNSSNTLSAEIVVVVMLLMIPNNANNNSNHSIIRIITDNSLTNNEC